MTVLQNPTRNKTLYTQTVLDAARFYCTSDKIRDKKKRALLSVRSNNGITVETHRLAAIKEVLTDKIKKEECQSSKGKAV